MSQPQEKKQGRRIRWEWLLSRLDHAAAWISALVLVLYVVSGYGLTRAGATQSLTGGLVTSSRAYALHNNLYIPLLVTFAFHTIMGLRRALIRSTRRKLVAGWVAAGAGAVGILYLALLGWA